MRVAWLGMLAGLIAAGPVAAQSWGVIQQPGGYGVARIEMAGNIRGLAVTCERGVPILALRPAALIGNPATAILKAGGRTATLRLVRNGSTDVWAAVLRDKAVLDMLAGGGTAAVAIDGKLGGAVPLAGADAAFASALKGCYAAPATARAPAPVTSAPADETPPAGGPVTVADEAAIRAILTKTYGAATGVPANADYEAPETPSFAALGKQCFDLDEEIAETCGGGVNPYTLGQDDDGGIVRSLKVALAPAPEPGMVLARATFRNFGKPYLVSYRFARVPGGWAIDDMFAGEPTAKNSFRETYRQGIIALSKGRIVPPPYRAPAAAASTAPAPGGAVTAADLAAVKAILTNYQRFQAGMGGQEMFQPPKTPAFTALEEQCFALDDEEGSNCIGGADPYLGGQDSNKEVFTTLKIDVAPSPAPGMIDAKLTFTNYGAPQKRLYRFARTPKGWAMDDVWFATTPTGSHLRGDYAEAIAMLKKQK